jgi:hypothetical protein
MSVSWVILVQSQARPQQSRKKKKGTKGTKRSKKTQGGKKGQGDKRTDVSSMVDRVATRDPRLQQAQACLTQRYDLIRSPPQKNDCV